MGSGQQEHVMTEEYMVTNVDRAANRIDQIV